MQYGNPYFAQPFQQIQPYQDRLAQLQNSYQQAIPYGQTQIQQPMPQVPQIPIEEKSIYGEAGMNVAWTGTAWDALGPAINMGDYIRVDSKVFTDLQETVSKCLIMLN